MGTSTFAEYTVMAEIALAKVSPLGAVIGCRLAGAERIIAVDLSVGRLAQARLHGATETRVADAGTVEWIRSETG